MGGSRQSVLLVEDEPDIAALEVECLEQERYVVAHARNGRHALDLLGLFRPSVIVLDLMMPEMDGLAFLAEYGRRPAPRAPVLAVSAFEDYVRIACQRGAAAGLPKPFDIDDLLRAVSAVERGAGVPGSAPPPLDERQRLRAVLELQLDQPTPGPALEALAQHVARVFDVPTCLVSIVTADRQYWHAYCGLPGDLAAARGSPREDSFCTHAVVAQAALVVQDTAENPLFADNRLVREHGFRFYAGVPLLVRGGLAVGTLCLLDVAPHTFTAFDLELLSVLARRVVAELEWRERRLAPGTPASAFRHLSWVDEELGILGRDAFVQALQVESLRASDRRLDLGLAVVAVPPDALEQATAALRRGLPRALLGRLGMRTIGVLATAASCDQLDAVARGCAPGAAAGCARVPRIVGGVEVYLRQVEDAVADGASLRAG